MTRSPRATRALLLATFFAVTYQMADPAAAAVEPLLNVGVLSKAPVAGTAQTEYTFTISNTGGAPAINTTAGSALPPGATYVSCQTSVGACSFSGGMVTFRVGDITVGQVITLKYRAQ